MCAEEYRMSMKNQQNEYLSNYIYRTINVNKEKNYSE